MSPRQEARAQGLKRYHSSPCKKCGGTERCVSDAHCVPCKVDRDNAYHEANKERLWANHKAYYAANKERILMRRKAYYEANKERFAERNKAYYASSEGRAIIFACAARRRATKVGAEGSYRPADIAAIFSAQNAKCAYCRKSLRKSGYHIDHIVPLSKGGTNWPRNLQLTCETCNLSKHALHPVEYAQRIGRLI